MKLIFVVSLGLVAILFGCSSPHQTVILDSWWDVDYAKQACINHNPCISDPVQAVHEYETALITQFSEQPECNSVKLVLFNGPEQSNKAVNDATKKMYWHLSLNYNTGSIVQVWQLLHSTSNSSVMQGQGTPKEIAKEVCIIVNGKGAKVTN